MCKTNREVQDETESKLVLGGTGGCRRGQVESDRVGQPLVKSESDRVRWNPVESKTLIKSQTETSEVKNIQTESCRLRWSQAESD